MVKRYFFLPIFLLFIHAANAQLPEQDCEYAIPVCQSSYSQLNSYVNVGNQQELTYPTTTSCLIGGEENSVWYIFTVTGAGDLEMQIAPNSPGDDYDWAIYNLTGSDCNGIGTGAAPEVRCNYSAIPGSTGMSFPYTQTSVGAGGPNQCAPLPVLVGETYVLIINNHANTFLGYTLNFSGTAVIYDTLPPSPVSLDPFTCSPPDTLHLTLSEPILCSSLAANGSDFYVVGPSLVNVIGAYSTTCSGGSFFNDVYIVLSAPITVNGNYLLRFQNDNLYGNTLLDNCGNALSLQDTVPFKVALANADFTPVLYNTCNGDSFLFIDNSEGDTVNSWVWDFGDGGSSNLQSPTHLYPATGSYSVTLSITDTLGCFDQQSITVNTYVEDPVAAFSISAPPYCAGIPIAFTGSSTGQGITYSWDFDGGGFSSQQNPVDTFAAGGTYTVVLTVTDSIGCFDSAQQTIDVLPPLEAIFSVYPDAVCVGDTITLTSTSTGNPTSYYWQGQGVTGETDSIVKTIFSAPGTFTITLTVTGSICPTDTSDEDVRVYAYPFVFLGEDTAICIDESITLLSGNPNYSNLWSTGDTTSAITISEVPQTVWVTVDDSGCITTDSIFVDSECPFYVPNAFTPNGDGINDLFKIITDGNQSFVFSIYNRWGQRLFYTTDANEGWDGTFKGRPEEMGVYVYQLETIFTNGVKRVRQGNITLIR